MNAYKLYQLLEDVPSGTKVNVTVLPANEHAEAQDFPVSDASFDRVGDSFDLFIYPEDPVYVVRGGPITQDQIDDGIYPPSDLGKIEWSFSDGPPGDRSYSQDYSDLVEGLIAHNGKRLDFTYAVPIQYLDFETAPGLATLSDTPPFGVTSYPVTLDQLKALTR